MNLNIIFYSAIIKLMPVILFLSFLILIFIILKKEKSSFLNSRKSTEIIILGIMASLASIFQSSPVFLPVVGMVLSPFSSLPIAIGTILFPRRAYLLYFATAVVTSFFSLQEAIIFVFTTGPVGLASSILVIKEKIKWNRIWIPIVTLSSGILVLIYVIGLKGMVDIINSNYIMYITLSIIVFSTIYTFIWIYGLAAIKKKLNL